MIRTLTIWHLIRNQVTDPEYSRSFRVYVATRRYRKAELSLRQTVRDVMK